MNTLELIQTPKDTSSLSNIEAESVVKLFSWFSGKLQPFSDKAWQHNQHRQRPSLKC